MDSVERKIVTREVWLQQRMALLQQEKKVTRDLDLLAIQRQQMPWVRIERDYVLESLDGPAPLAELFGGYSQLIVYHFMFGTGWAQPCDGCSQWADALNGTLPHIHAHDANLIVVSTAPPAQLEAARKRNGWTFQWLSSHRSPFNSDYNMSVPLDCPSKRVADEIIFYDRGESGGINVFARMEDEIFHTYSAYNRGIQQMNGAFGYVDLLPYGGN